MPDIRFYDIRYNIQRFINIFKFLFFLLSAVLLALPVLILALLVCLGRCSGRAKYLVLFFGGEIFKVLIEATRKKEKDTILAFLLYLYIRNLMYK